MSVISPTDRDRARVALAAMFRNSPVLVEVRFPNMGTSPDWYLCHAEEDLTSIFNRLSPGVELHLSSVWDLQNRAGELTLKK